jgi:predicted nuclease of restriction endonuclease-like (RecB) superfamily
MHEAINETWNVKTLDRNIASQFYYRLLQSHNKHVVKDEMKQITENLQKDKLEFIKNPIVAEFLGLSPNTDLSETHLESAIITHLQNFIMELGKGYAFVARQQHIHTDMGDFYIDLVFYNYILKCFLLVDLKTERITHQDVGQMDMYVRMYDKLKRTEGDNPTIGLILCSETSEDMARYSVLNDNNHLFQAKYLTFLPSTEVLINEIKQQKIIFELQSENK